MGTAAQGTQQRRATAAAAPDDGRGVGVEWSLDPRDSAAVPRLRHRIVECLGRLAGPGADLADAELVVAELLANAVEHTTGPAWVSLRWEGSHPLLSVADLGPGLHGGTGGRDLLARLPEDQLSTSGRGLYLVSRLALDVAVAPRRTGGTVVSVTLDLARPAD